MLVQYQQAVTEHRQRIYSFACYSLRAVEDAEDITQEVFIKLWQHWRKIDHDKLSAWLMRVAHNAVIDHLRRSKNSRQVDDFADAHRTEPCQQAMNHSVTSSSSRSTVTWMVI